MEFSTTADQITVDFIGRDDDIVFPANAGQLPYFIVGPDASHRIVGAAQKQQLGFGVPAFSSRSVKSIV